MTSPAPDAQAPAFPGPDERWRCAQCGNLTRFDLTRTRRTREFIHVDLAGEQRVESEETEVLAEDITEIRCRWCGSTAIQVVPRPATP
jgi:hypothetical protein